MCDFLEFSTILIDPPWPERGGGKCKRGADRRYKVMGKRRILDAIRESDVWAPAVNCHLYLCVTNNRIPDGLWLIEQLGFRYVTCITWEKPRMGLGQYFRGKTEQIFFAVRGDGMSLRMGGNPGKDRTTSLPAPHPKGKDGRIIHSAKPEELYSLIERSSPPNRLDMFARKRRPGWAVWGDQIEEHEGGL